MATFEAAVDGLSLTFLVTAEASTSATLSEEVLLKRNFSLLTRAFSSLSRFSNAQTLAWSDATYLGSSMTGLYTDESANGKRPTQQSYCLL